MNAIARHLRSPFGRLVLRFAAWFCALDVLVIVLTTRTTLIAGAETLTAGAARALISLTGVPATLAGHQVTVPGRILEISVDCTGLFVAMTLVALLLAYPVELPLRLLGVAVGVPAIVVVNLLRLVLVAQFAVHAPTLFPFVHDFLFQIGMMLAAAVVWVVWLTGVRRHALG